LCFESSGSRGRGALREREGGMEIVVMRKHKRPSPIVGHERFTVAHELGHYFLLKESNVRPRRDAEYWLYEELCNRFASTLLIPAKAFEDVREPATARELAVLVNSIATGVGVTAEPAARAVVSYLQTPVAIGTFLANPLARTNRLGFRGWWAESRPWWGRAGARRLAVYCDHPLAPVFDAMARISAGQTATVSIQGAASTFLRRRGENTASFTAVLDSYDPACTVEGFGGVASPASSN
jgi:hypothetical protein